jgi:hypothetical protein
VAEPELLPGRLGRPTKLTASVRAEIVKYASAGIPFDSACRLAGINPSTGHDWLTWGRAALVLRRGETVDVTTLPNRKLPRNAGLFADFAEGVERARAQDEATRIARMGQAAIGGHVVYRKTHETRYPDGRVMVTTEEKLAAPDWRPDAWHLERSNPGRWDRRTRDDDAGMPDFLETLQKAWELRGKDPRALPPAGEPARDDERTPDT